MAKYVIEFDEKEGCKNCPFCQFKEGFEILGETGFYCTNRKPNKLISYAVDKDKEVKRPYWCNLTLYDPVPASIPGRYMPSSEYFKNTERIIVQKSINPNMFIMCNGLLDIDKHIKDYIIHEFVNNPVLKQSIKWTEMSDPSNYTKIIRGELEIVKPDNRSTDTYSRDLK